MASDGSLEALLDAIKEKYPPTLPPQSWYLVAASALIAGPDPALLGRVWLYLTKQPEYQSPEQRCALNTRLRELIMKQWVTIGIVKSAVAFVSLLKEEKPGDVDPTFTRSQAAIDEKNRDAGAAFLEMVYGPENSAKMMQSWGPDIEWLTKDIVYGLFFADDRILGNLETELITFTSIAVMKLRMPLMNHLEGLQRMGLSANDAQLIMECTEMGAKWGSKDETPWLTVKELIPNW